MHRRKLLCGLAAAPLLVSASTARAADPPTEVSGVDVTAPRIKPAIQPYSPPELFRPAPALDTDLSADGKHVGLLFDGGEGDQRQTQLMVFSADDPTVGEARFNLGQTNAHWVRWAGSGRLLVGVSGSSPTDFNRRSRNYQRFTDQERELPYKRVMSVSLDGTPAVQLFQPAAGPRVRVPPEKFRRVLNLAEIVEVPNQDHALMAAFDKEDANPSLWTSYPSRHGGGLALGLRQFYASQQIERGPPLSTVSLYRVDLATGEPALLQEGSNLTMRWESQDGQPILRRDINPDGKGETWRTQTGGGPWKPVRSVSRADPDLIFLTASDTPRSVWVLGRQPGETQRSVRLWNIDTGALAAPVSSRPDRSPVTVLFDDQRRFLLASYRGAAGLSHDSPDASLTATLTALAIEFGAGAAVKVLHIAPDQTRMLLEISGPQQPRAYYLFDSGRRRLADIGGGQRLKPERLADAEPIVVAQTGGQPAQGVLTGSLDGTPGGLIVVLQPASDPDSLYSFDPLAQLLATRGWWTLRVAEAEPSRIRALMDTAVTRASLDPAKVAILGEGTAGRAALSQAGAFQAAISFESPEPEAALLDGASVGARNDHAVQATAGGKALLVVRNWRDARGGRRSDRRTGDAMMQNDAGTLADAIAIGEAGDADWTKLESVVARAVSVVDFLAPILR